MVSEVRCVGCGRRMSERDVFCLNCGTPRVSDEAEVPNRPGATADAVGSDRSKEQTVQPGSGWLGDKRVFFGALVVFIALMALSPELAAGLGGMGCLGFSVAGLVALARRKPAKPQFGIAGLALVMGMGAASLLPPKPAESAKSAANPQAEAKAIPQPKAEPAPAAQPQAEAKAIPQPKAEPASAAQPQPEAKAIPQPKAEPASAAQPQAEVKASTKPMAQADARPAAVPPPRRAFAVRAAMQQMENDAPDTSAPPVKWERSDLADGTERWMASTQLSIYEVTPYKVSIVAFVAKDRPSSAADALLGMARVAHVAFGDDKTCMQGIPDMVTQASQSPDVQVTRRCATYVMNLKLLSSIGAWSFDVQPSVQ